MFNSILVGLGRALSEVGAIIIVGGNIIHYTRVMTTTIALETAKGNLTLAMSLGIILIFISLFLNLLALSIQHISKKILMINKNELISLKNINLTLDKKLIFENFSLNFFNDGITVILGPNGSGKTLLTKVILGLTKIDKGAVNLKENKTTFGYAPQKITF